MEQVFLSNAHAAPLHIKKSAANVAAAVHDIGKAYDMEKPLPDTPQQEDMQNVDEDTQPERPLFQNYLRAFYPFQPSDSLSPSTITLPLIAGDMILVHSIHTNGWADGTLLNTGARGWLPTNYCEPYEHASMAPLLKALIEFWDVIRCGNA